MDGKNIIVTGAINIGKSSTIRKVLSMIDKPRYGYITEKIGSIVFINPVNGEPVYDKDRVVALLGNGRHPVNETFNSLGVEYLSNIPSKSLVIMDEIGPIESTAEQFCKRILDVMDSDCTVIISMRKEDHHWLNQIKNHPLSVIYEVTAENRENLWEQIYKNHFCSNY